MVETLYKRLFKLNSDNISKQIWEIHRTPDDMSYWTVSGKLGCKMTTSSPRAVKAKVNRTQAEQIVLEMDSRISNQQRKKYVENIEDVGATADDALPGYSAMLAKKWADQKKKIKFPCVVQPKLDGIRCLATKDGFFSRGRKPIEACQHIREQLKHFFERYPEAQLDGELYSHDLKDDFETIIKAVRKTNEKATDEDFTLQRQVQYHVYDCPRIDELDETSPFMERFVVIDGLLDAEAISVRLVTTIIVDSEDKLMEQHTSFLCQGYEGTMVRNMDMPYEGKRSDNLLKLKEFDEDEYLIIGVNEGRGGLVGHAGAFQLQTAEGSEFKAKLEGKVSRLKYLWEHPHEVIGKMCTVRYQGLTNKEGVPRFPVAKSVRGLVNKKDEWL